MYKFLLSRFTERTAALLITFWYFILLLINLFVYIMGNPDGYFGYIKR